MASPPLDIFLWQMPHGQALRPDIAMVLNVNAVHLGQFGSIEGIADEKFSLLTSLPADGTAIYNADDALLRIRAESLRRKSFSFGLSEDASLRVRNFRELGV